MNVFTFTGNLGRDAEVRQAGQQPVCGFSVAVKAGHGEREQTIWVDCSLWGKRAEGGLPAYLLKGQQVAVTGELGTREHEGKTYLTCNVREISLVGGKSEGGQQGGYGQTQQQPMNHQQQGYAQQQPNPQQWQGQQQGGYQQQQQQRQPVSGTNAQQPNPQAQSGFSQPQQPPVQGEDFDPDIPF